MERALHVAALALSPIGGWLFAGYGDPSGALMRWTIGWLVGEFR